MKVYVVTKVEITKRDFFTSNANVFITKDEARFWINTNVDKLKYIYHHKMNEIYEDEVLMIKAYEYNCKELGEVKIEFQIYEREL